MEMKKVLQRSISLCIFSRYLYRLLKYCLMIIIVLLKLLKLNYHLLGNHVVRYTILYKAIMNYRYLLLNIRAASDSHYQHNTAIALA